jgi:hypothetical protein
LLLAALARGLVAVAGAGAAALRGGKSSPEISITEAGEEWRAACGVGVALADSTGAGVESLSQPIGSAVWLGAGDGLSTLSQ